MQTQLTMLPPPDEMYAAVSRRDADFDGIFLTAVTSTGIFCRPSCPAKTPRRENVEFFATARDALFAGYRPCLRCRPLEPAGSAPSWLKPLLDDVAETPTAPWSDDDLRARGLEPARVRRWFKSQYGMTFQAYRRGLRLGRAMGQLKNGASVTSAAFDSGYDSLSGFNDALQQLAGRPPAATRDATPVVVTRLLTPLGPMIAGATDDGLCLLEFSDRRMLETQLQRLAKLLPGPLAPGRHPMLERIEDELQHYFAGTLQDFTMPLVVPGSEFQRHAWTALRAIPYGETRSYAQQAAAIGRPEAVRAVARANGDNRIAIVIPCHRVVGADGKLTGYGGGLWRKRWLLELERGRT
jgi:AraC family transcriptional regulator, regulatory protein of adaptative response / methylated-DNA-[protein]-cysteine methyltransferase